MVGWRKDEYSSNTESNQQSTLRSDITSQKGNVSLQAGNDVSVHGAGISAGKSLVVSGNNVLFDVSEDSLKSHSESSSMQYGLQGQVSGWAASAAQNIERTARSAQDDRDPRLTGIYATQAGLDAATQTMQGNMDPSAFKVSVTATAGTSSQEQDQSSRQQQGTPCTPGTPSSSKDVKDLDADQRTFISNLATAGGSVGGDTFSASSGANAARVKVENNYLSNTDITAFTEKYAAAKTDAEKEQLLAELKKLDVVQQTKALATGIPVNEQKAELEKLKILGASLDCNTQCQQLVAYSISELEPVANNTELHKNNLYKAILAGVIFGLTVDKPTANSPISRLTKEQQQLIRSAETITTAKGIQNPFPRDLNEKIVWNQVRANPSAAGEPLKGMNSDPRFPTSAGFQKMEAKQKLSDGSTITVHYQYNSYTGKAYDMKITTHQRNVSDPVKVINSIKDVAK